MAAIPIASILGLLQKIFSVPSINVKFKKEFRPTIGTWCKGTTFMGGTENVTIAMAFELLVNYLPSVPCISRMPRCSLFGMPVRISTGHNWS